MEPELYQYIFNSNKGDLLYDTIFYSSGLTPFQIYNLFGLDILTILFLQLRYGFRISELLRTTCRNIKDRYTLIVPGAKHSRYRLCELPYQHPALLQTCRCGGHNIFSLTYKQIWRVYNQLALTSSSSGCRINRSVTHIGRVRLINSLARSGLPPDAIKDIIGHKTVKSLNYYLNKEN